MKKEEETLTCEELMFKEMDKLRDKLYAQLNGEVENFEINCDESKMWSLKLEYLNENGREYAGAEADTFAELIKGLKEEIGEKEIVKEKLKKLLPKKQYEIFVDVLDGKKINIEQNTQEYHNLQRAKKKIKQWHEVTSYWSILSSYLEHGNIRKKRKNQEKKGGKEQ